MAARIGLRQIHLLPHKRQQTKQCLPEKLQHYCSQLDFHCDAGRCPTATLYRAFAGISARETLISPPTSPNSLRISYRHPFGRLMYQRPARSVSAGLMSATRRQLGNLRRATPTPIRSTHYVVRSYPNVLSLHGTHTAPCRLTGGWLASSYPTKIQAPRCSVMMCTLRPIDREVSA
ncbi:uncharacterized protein QC763_0030870 [Podospora pseudopauciseta]|uniref:Uncharacterized protein n=1 Tax=Podospora pseudopauciseta TaxID=2093780 RepID=A0ABR0HNA3_9PEZI|nr:hypothetical protein QC763_0030870 [Podospora pseudopauciseta]